MKIIALIIKETKWKERSQMSAATLTETKSNISHAINNRLNTLILGMSILEANQSPEAQTIVRSLKMELRDLQALIEQLKQSA
jgi:t-SNARE complex subunit (syntaxin)